MIRRGSRDSAIGGLGVSGRQRHARDDAGSMGVSSRPDVGDDALRRIVVERLAVWRRCSFRERAERGVPAIGAAPLQAREHVFEQCGRARIRGESGDCPQDIGTLAELRPIESEGAQQRFVLFELGLRRWRELETIGEEQVLTGELPMLGRVAERVVANQRIGPLAVEDQKLLFGLADQQALTDLSDQAKPIRAARFVPAARLCNTGGGLGR